MKSHITLSKNPKTGWENAQTPNATPQLTSRPFAPISKQTTSPIAHRQQEQTEGLVQRKTNLLEISGLTAAPKNLVQAKLRIGQSGDKYEQEADALVPQVVQRLHMPTPGANTDMRNQYKSASQRMKDNILLQRSPKHQPEIPTPKTNLLKRAAMGTKGQIMSHTQMILQRQEDSGNGMTAGPDLDLFFRQGESNPGIQLEGSVSNVSSQVVQRVEQEQEEKMDIDSEEPDLSSKTKKRKITGNEEKPHKKIKQSNQEQEDNKTYLQGIRKKLGEKLGRKNKPISQVELNSLIGEIRWATKFLNIYYTKAILPEDREKVDNLLKKSRTELEEILKSSEVNKPTKKQEDNRTYLQGIRETLGEKLERKNKSIAQAELSFLIGRDSAWAMGVETGATKAIKPADQDKLKDLLTKSKPQLENLLKDFGLNKLSEKQEGNKTYIQGIREKLGAKLERKNKLIALKELDDLLGRVNWSANIGTGQIQEIKPEYREKLEDLLTKSKTQLENLLKDCKANKFTEEQKLNKTIVENTRKKLGKRLGRGNEPINRLELDTLMDKNVFSLLIETGKHKKMALEDKQKLKDLLTKSPSELKKLLNIKEQKGNKTYLVRVRKELGQKLGRNNEPITQLELDTLLGKSEWSVGIEMGYKIIQPEYQEKLDNLLAKSPLEFKKLFKLSVQDQEGNKTYLVDVRKKLGKTLGQNNEPITQLELDTLLGKTEWSVNIETGQIRTIQLEDQEKLKDLLTKSQQELENLFKDYEANKFTEEPEDNITYLRGIRKKLGETLERSHQRIDGEELDALIGKTGFSENTEKDKYKEIAPDDKEKLKDLLTKSKPELKNLFKDYRAKKDAENEEQKDNKTYLLGVRKKLGKKLGRGTQPITREELNALIGKTGFSEDTEKDTDTEIAPENKQKLKSILDKPRLELENFLKYYKDSIFTEGQEDSQTYLVGVRKELGKNLGRGKQPITRIELDALMDQENFSRNTENATYKIIASEDKQKLNSILDQSKSKSGLANIKLLLEPYEEARTQKNNELLKQSQALAKPLLDQNPNLGSKKKGRQVGFIVTDDSARSLDYDSQQTSGSQRLSTYASTLALANWPRGAEFQGSIKHDRTSIALSSNYNKINAYCRNSIKMASDLQNLAAKSLINQNIEAMSREDAMNNRDIRHALKLYERLPLHLELDADVLVPQSSPSQHGIHAEIRIVSGKKWNKSDWDAPSGTKYPCLGCYLHLNSQEIEIGHFHGPLWLTNAGLSQQLKASLKGKNDISEMSSTEISDTAELLATSYAQRPHDSEFVMGLPRSGKPTYDQNADSDSDLDEETFTSVVKRVKAHQSGALPTRLKKDVNGRFINQTVGDGNCFFHAVYEAMYNIRSTQADQATIRERVIHELLENTHILQDVLGQIPDDNAITQEIDNLGEGQWTQDYHPGLVATALGLTIVIYHEQGGVEETISPLHNRPSHATIYMSFTGNHFNSHTHNPLSQ
ncbi:MAG: hypothetical protein V7K21_07700 [Nostoc sp.]|uniref:hypothetical protein n=1 Tax=Nostoc sp. TaxID=1180 RepID=UPI002FF732E8